MRRVRCQVPGARYQVFKKLSLVLLAVGFFFFGCARKETVNIGSSGTSIVCYGDSLTFGYGAGPGEDYPTALAKLVDVPVVNAGVDGDTSAEGLGRIDSGVLDRDPFLVIIEFCGNDFLKKVPMEETLKNISAMIDKIHAYGSMVALVDISAGLLLKEYRQQFRQLARRKNVLFIPAILSGIVTNPSLKSDFLHPNASGYSMIAHKIYRAISPYLQKNKLARLTKK